MEPNKEQDQVYRQDQKKQVKIKGGNIAGDLGSNVVIRIGSTTAVNVGGGETTGDVYKVVSDSEASSLENIQNNIEKGDFSADQKDQLNGDLNILKDEINKGESAEESFVNLILRDMQGLSPQVAAASAEWILNTGMVNDSVLVVAKEFLNPTS